MSIYIEWWKIKKKLRCSVKKYSLTSFHLQSLSHLDDVTTGEDKSQFIWHNIKDRYSSRTAELNDTNLYQFCANNWVLGEQIILQFFGYHDHPTWPLKEEYVNMDFCPI